MESRVAPVLGAPALYLDPHFFFPSARVSSGWTRPASSRTPRLQMGTDFHKSDCSISHIGLECNRNAISRTLNTPFLYYFFLCISHLVYFPQKLFDVLSRSIISRSNIIRLSLIPNSVRWNRSVMLARRVAAPPLMDRTRYDPSSIIDSPLLCSLFAYFGAIQLGAITFIYL